MGEYAKYNGKEIKIGTCEEMYYLRFDQRRSVQPLPNSLDPVKEAAELRFRFPWPDEDQSEPGGNGKGFDPFRRLRIDGVSSLDQVDHGLVQFKATNGNGYLVSLPCPEGKVDLPITFHKNGYGGAVHLVQQRIKNGLLVPVFECGGCRNKWRIEDPAELEPYLVAVRSMADQCVRNSDTSGAKWHYMVADRMTIQPID